MTERRELIDFLNKYGKSLTPAALLLTVLSVMLIKDSPLNIGNELYSSLFIVILVIIISIITFSFSKKCKQEENRQVKFFGHLFFAFTIMLDIIIINGFPQGFTSLLNLVVYGGLFYGIIYFVLKLNEWVYTKFKNKSKIIDALFFIALIIVILLIKIVKFNINPFLEWITLSDVILTPQNYIDLTKFLILVVFIVIFFDVAKAIFKLIQKTSKIIKKKIKNFYKNKEQN